MFFLHRLHHVFRCLWMWVVQLTRRLPCGHKLGPDGHIFLHECELGVGFVILCQLRLCTVLNLHGATKLWMVRSICHLLQRNIHRSNKPGDMPRCHMDILLVWVLCSDGYPSDCDSAHNISLPVLYMLNLHRSAQLRLVHVIRDLPRWHIIRSDEPWNMPDWFVGLRVQLVPDNGSADDWTAFDCCTDDGCTNNECTVDGCTFTADDSRACNKLAQLSILRVLYLHSGSQLRLVLVFCNVSYRYICRSKPRNVPNCIVGVLL